MSEPLENLKKARKEHNDCLCCVIKDAAIDGVLELFATQQSLIEGYEEWAKDVKRLTKEISNILHPKGDGPISPSLCDIVAYIQHDSAQQVLIKQLVDACKTALDFEEDEDSSPKNQEIFTKLLAVLAVAEGL